LFTTLLVAALLTSCGGTDARPPGLAQGVTPVSPTNGAVTVRAFEWGFEPDAIVVPLGKPVQLVFENEGRVFHNLEVRGLKAAVAGGDELRVEAQGGEGATLSFTPEDSGAFTFLCTVAGHRRLGMEGVLLVE
jgi:plastocyanin